MNKNEFYWPMPESKAKKIIICKSPGMDLFMALMLAPYSKSWGFKKKPRKLDYFPLEVTDCKCRNCRYWRWRLKYE